MGVHSEHIKYINICMNPHEKIYRGCTEECMHFNNCLVGNKKLREEVNIKTNDLDKEVLYDVDHIQLVKRKDEETGEVTYSIITPETYVVLTEEIFNEIIQHFFYFEARKFDKINGIATNAFIDELIGKKSDYLRK